MYFSALQKERNFSGETALSLSQLWEAVHSQKRQEQTPFRDLESVCLASSNPGTTQCSLSKKYRLGSETTWRRSSCRSISCSTADCSRNWHDLLRTRIWNLSDSMSSAKEESALSWSAFRNPRWILEGTTDTGTEGIQNWGSRYWRETGCSSGISGHSSTVLSVSSNRHYSKISHQSTKTSCRQRTSRTYTDYSNLHWENLHSTPQYLVRALGHISQGTDISKRS